MTVMGAVSNPYWNLNLGPALIMALLTTVPLTVIVIGLTSTQPSWKKLAWRLLLLPGLLLLNPCSQWIALEPLNMHLLTRMAGQARETRLEGRKAAEVEALFGRPSFTWTYANEPGAETWNYMPLPFYLAGSKFQVHFQRGTVTGWEAYDD
jgi:hypothetical protein